MAIRPKRFCTIINCRNYASDKTGLCDAHFKEKEQKRKQIIDQQRKGTYHDWYSSTAWRKLRMQKLKESPLCIECKFEHKLTAATVVDHIKPHKGNRDLFFDKENLQSLCKRHHDIKTAKEDGGFNNVR